MAFVRSMAVEAFVRKNREHVPAEMNGGGGESGCSQQSQHRETSELGSHAQQFPPGNPETEWSILQKKL